MSWIVTVGVLAGVAPLAEWYVCDPPGRRTIILPMSAVRVGGLPPPGPPSRRHLAAALAEADLGAGDTVVSVGLHAEHVSEPKLLSVG